MADLVSHGSFPLMPGLRLALEVPGAGMPAELMLLAVPACPFVPQPMWGGSGWVALSMGADQVAVRFERVATLGNEAVFRAVEWRPVPDAMQAPEGPWLHPSGRRLPRPGAAS